MRDEKEVRSKLNHEFEIVDALNKYAQEDNIVVTKKGPVNLTPLEKKLQW